MKNSLIGLGLLTFILLIIFGPFIAIWGLNTLFKLGIPYTIETYFAVFAVSLFLHPVRFYRKG